MDTSKEASMAGVDEAVKNCGLGSSGGTMVRRR